MQPIWRTCCINLFFVRSEDHTQRTGQRLINMLRRSAAFLVVVLVVFQNAGQTSSFTLRRNVRREPVPPHELPPDQARYAPVVPPHDKPLPEVPPNGLPQKPGTRYQPSPPQKPLPDLPVPANGIPQKPGSRYQPPLPQKPFPDNQLPSNGLPQKPSSRYQPSLPQKPLPDLPTNGLPQKPGTRYQPSPPQKPLTDLPAPPDGLPQVPAPSDGKPSQETAKLLSILRDIRAELVWYFVLVEFFVTSHMIGGRMRIWLAIWYYIVGTYLPEIQLPTTSCSKIRCLSIRSHDLFEFMRDKTLFSLIFFLFLCHNFLSFIFFLTHYAMLLPSSVVARFLLQPATRCQTISMIRRSAKTLLGDRYKDILVCVVLEALRNCAI